MELHDPPYFRAPLPDPSSLAPPRRRQGRQPVAVTGADAPPRPRALREAHPATHGGATAPPARNKAVIPKPRSAIHGGASGSTLVLPRAHPSKKASGADAAQFPPVPVLIPMPQNAPASGPNATDDVGMNDAHHLLDEIPPRCVLDFFAVISSSVNFLLGQGPCIA